MAQWQTALNERMAWPCTPGGADGARASAVALGPIDVPCSAVSWQRQTEFPATCHSMRPCCALGWYPGGSIRGPSGVGPSQRLPPRRVAVLMPNPDSTRLRHPGPPSALSASVAGDVRDYPNCSPVPANNPCPQDYHSTCSYNKAFLRAQDNRIYDNIEVGARASVHVRTPWDALFGSRLHCCVQLRYAEAPVALVVHGVPNVLLHTRGVPQRCAVGALLYPASQQSELGSHGWHDRPLEATGSRAWWTLHCHEL